MHKFYNLINNEINLQIEYKFRILITAWTVFLILYKVINQKYNKYFKINITRILKYSMTTLLIID